MTEGEVDRRIDALFAAFGDRIKADTERREGPGRRASDFDRGVAVGNVLAWPFKAPDVPAANDPAFDFSDVPNNALNFVECPHALDFCAKWRARFSRPDFSTKSLFCAAISRYIPADPASPPSVKLSASL